MDVGTFSANINAFRGLQNPSKFRLRAFPRFASTVNFLEYFCESVSLPGSTVATATGRPLGYGPVMATPLTTVYDPVTANFMMDNAGSLLDQMTSWQQRAVNHNYEPGGALSESNGASPFVVGYVDDYAARVVITTYAQDGSTISSYTLHDAWPSSIGTVQLSWSAKDQISVLPVTFSYRSWTSTHMFQEDQ